MIIRKSRIQVSALFSKRYLFVPLLTSFLVACGGGGGGTAASGGATNQAVLGPLAGADIYAYRLTDLNSAIEGPIAADSSVSDLDAAGRFELSLTGIADDEWILVAASGGQDIDDDGVIDPTASLHDGTSYALAKASDWRAGDVRVTALSDIAWRYAKDQIADNTALATRLELLASWLIATDNDGDSGVDYDDLLLLNPRQASAQSAIVYSALLPSDDFANPNHIDRLHSDETESVIFAALVAQFGSTPWIADKNPDSFTFASQSGVAVSSLIESNTIIVAGINRVTAIGITGGEYRINGGRYTNAAGTVRNGDTVSVSVTSPANNGTATSATVTIGDASDSFVVTTFISDAFLSTINITMVAINAAGESFEMGCDTSDATNIDPACRVGEKPEHVVTFSTSFAMSAHEVSWDAWDACVADGGCSAAVDGGYGRGDRPVINVSYDDVFSEFIPWLNGKTGNDYRLPSETEWEYAARTGTHTVYSWGDTVGSNNANCWSCGGGVDGGLGTAPVGSYVANGIGLYDLHGNVWEWVQDIYNDDYEGAPTDGSARNSGSGGTDRAVRGGSWINTPVVLRLANRGRAISSFRGNGVGFRIARDN
ncbi:MAG: formylglycine-generating enzyme family protein [Halopseudomonas sp.]